ncbi:hypothetical protein RJ639_023789 [Escallonia herrerae]|uniref:Chitin-binding type-1 domain-containing protein n=1 Tax=Escallonia herrerae TaxID=1293975 RepID=A0AA89ACS4_9ASTE|nr:hypothetical protein RJ639_023789 [Escallonia herrerae]
MVAFSMRKRILAILLALVLTGALPESVFGQDCACAASLCCSEWGYCGTGNAYCGPGCREGPCYMNNASVADIVTDAFLNGIIGQAAASCAGKSFYTRAAFIQAVGSYPRFGTTGSTDDSNRHNCCNKKLSFCADFCHKEEIDGPFKDYCDENNTQYPCVLGKGYYGRGPLHLSWNYNYGPAGQSIGFNGINNPDIVASDVLVSFKASLWFWMTSVHSVVINQGFGASIRAINGQLP